MDTNGFPDTTLVLLKIGVLPSFYWKRKTTFIFDVRSKRVNTKSVIKIE